MTTNRTFFRSWPADASPEQLLDPGEQFSEPWGEHEHGPCDKCEGSGTTRYECSSCLAGGALAGCPACRGRVRFEAVCPACLGDGTIDDTVRRGVAALPTRAGLYRYLGLKDAPRLEEKVVVELEGPLTDELDLDADVGTVLVLPRRIVALEPLHAAAIDAGG